MLLHRTGLPDLYSTVLESNLRWAIIWYDSRRREKAFRGIDTQQDVRYSAILVVT